MLSNPENPERWRLILEPPLSGPANMAIDEAILQAVGRGAALPTLRLFRWEPSCLSLGYAQPVSDADRDRLAARGWGIVRRLTGGRAILHADELTYSVALPADHPLAAGSIMESYRRLSRALLVALHRLGLSAGADQRVTSARSLGPICFEVPSDYEITADGKKLIGSAQVRKYGGVLQHGTLPLEGDVARICDGLVFADEAERQIARERVRARATTFAGAAGAAPAWNEAAAAMIVGFAETFALTFEQTALSAHEASQAAELERARYSDPEWIAKM